MALQTTNPQVSVGSGFCNFCARTVIPAVKPALDEAVACGNFLSRTVQKVSDQTCTWVEKTWGKTAGTVARKAVEVLPEVACMLLLFSGFSVIPLTILAARTIVSISDAIRSLIKTDKQAARGEAITGFKLEFNRCVRGAIVSSFVTAGLLGAFGLCTASPGLIARGGVFLILGLAGKDHFIPASEVVAQAIVDPAPQEAPAA